MDVKPEPPVTPLEAELMTMAALQQQLLLVVLVLVLLLLAVVGSSAGGAGGGGLLRRHSRLSEEYKQWLGQKSYLQGVVDGSVVPTPDGRTVAQRDIAQGAEIVVVPQHLVLSWRTIDPRRDPSSALGRAILAEPKLFPARLILPIWLCYERHRPDSLWRPYLLSLPSKHDLPISWRDSELARLSNSSWLGEATAADRASLLADHEASMSRLCALYPPDEDGGGASGGFTDKVCSTSTWLWAWGTIWSRGVSIDLVDPSASASDGIPAKLKAAALVPFADMINHAGPKHANAQASWDTARSAWIVKSVRAIRTGNEVLIVYGDSGSVHPAGRAVGGNAWLLQRYGFVQPAPSGADSVTVKLLLGSSAPLAEMVSEADGAVHRLDSAVDKMSRRALNRALFDAVEDSHELRLRHPEAAGGTAALRLLRLHAVARVVADPGSWLDTFANGADIAALLETEIEQQEQEQPAEPGLSASSLRKSALRYALMLIEGWLGPYSSLTSSVSRRSGKSGSAAATEDRGDTAGSLAAIVARGRDQFCDPSGSMRDVRDYGIATRSFRELWVYLTRLTLYLESVTASECCRYVAAFLTWL